MRFCICSEEKSEEAFHLVEEDYCDNEWSSKISRNILADIQCYIEILKGKKNESLSNITARPVENK